MALKTILFVVLFATATIGALVTPLLGVLGYVAHYSIGPDRQWWAQQINQYGIRYAYTLAIVTAVGMALHWSSLRFGKQLLRRQEWLILLFLGYVWLSTVIGGPTNSELYRVVDHPSVKMLKMVIFVFMMTHVVTMTKRLDWLFWTVVGCVLLLGLQARYAGSSAFIAGRLEGVGGSDFTESNVLAAFMAGMLPILGIQFFRSPWWGKLICAASGVLACDAIVLTRSRGAVVGLAVAAVVATILAPSKYRGKLLVAVAAAGVGLIMLADQGFMNRASTIEEGPDERDVSARGRIETWTAAWNMFKDHPLGVGVGNFQQNIGRYDARYTNRDAHNTFVRCLAELGIPGVALLGALILNAFWMLRRVIKRSRELAQPAQEHVFFAAYGLAVGLAAMLACGMTITLLYVEALWWMLALPLCAERVLENALADEAEAKALQAKTEPASKKRRPPVRPKWRPKPQPEQGVD